MYSIINFIRSQFVPRKMFMAFFIFGTVTGVLATEHQDASDETPPTTMALDPDAFVFTVRTSAANEEVFIPAFNSGLTYNYDVDWDGDGVFESTGNTGVISHTYATAGLYQIQIKGQLPQLNNSYFDSNRLQWVSIDQWGAIAWESMERMFFQCRNLTYNATDIPDLRNVTTMDRMFVGCSSFNGDLSNWDVSTITNMRYMFSSGFTNTDRPVMRHNFKVWV